MDNTIDPNKEPLHIQRIRKELQLLKEKGQQAELLPGAAYVLYRGVETGGAAKQLPTITDVLVPVPAGYPAAAIDMPALPADSALIPFVVGGSNPQMTVSADGRNWKVLSYHPYTNGGGPPWDPGKHGFFDYYTHIYVWLHRLL